MFWKSVAGYPANAELVAVLMDSRRRQQPVPESAHNSQPSSAAAKITRRTLLSGAAVTAATAVGLMAQRPVRGAAIQLQPKLGDVSGNLERAERLIREAIVQRADARREDPNSGGPHVMYAGTPYARIIGADCVRSDGH